MRIAKTKRVALDIRGLTGREELFRISGATAHDPAVDQWFADESIVLRSLARNWFEVMRACGADVRALVHDGCPVACIPDAPFGYVNAFKSHVNVGFFNGAMLDDRAGLLEGAGKRMRHVKVKPGSDINASALRELIEAAYLDVKTRLEQVASSL